MNDFFNGKFGLILAPDEQADFMEQCKQNGIEVNFSFVGFSTTTNAIVLAELKVNGRAFPFRNWRKQNGLFERVSVSTEDATIKVNFGNKAAGVAKCRPGDKFDLELGAAIAMCRAIGAEKFNKALEIAKES